MAKLDEVNVSNFGIGLRRRFESLDQNVVGARIRWWRRLKVAIRGLGSPKAKGPFSLESRGSRGRGCSQRLGGGWSDVPEHEHGGCSRGKIAGALNVA